MKYFHGLLIFKILKIDIESDASEPNEDLCDLFAPTKDVEEFRKSLKLFLGFSNYSIIG